MNPTEHPITEDDIANFLANTPDFFERHAELLASVQLSSGHGNRAVSLQERQALMLREKIKGLETRMVEMIRHGQDNVGIADKMQRWTRKLLQAAQARDLPGAVVEGITTEFLIPQAAIKVWSSMIVAGWTGRARSHFFIVCWNLSTFPQVVGWLGVELIWVIPRRRSSCSKPLRPPRPPESRVVKTIPLSVSVEAGIPCSATALRNWSSTIGPVTRVGAVTRSA